MNHLPPDWTRKRLKRLGTLCGGAGFPIDEQGLQDQALPFFKVKDLVAPRVLVETDNSISRQTAGELRARIFPEGTFVFAKVGAALLLNRFRVLGHEGCIDNNMMGFELMPKRHSQDFFFYALGQLDFSSIHNQGPIPSVSGRQIGDLFVAVPPLPEQQRIAAYLDASCAAIDAAVAAKRRQIETLDALRHSNIFRAVTRGIDNSAVLKESGISWLGETPSHWTIRRIKDIAELRSGNAIQSEDITPAGEYPVYGGNGLRGYTSSFTHDGHFVLIGRQGALCGNINYANGKFWATEHAIVVTLLGNYDTLWVGELLRVMNLNQCSNAAAQPGLAVDRIKFLRLPIPPVEEQIRIAQYVKDIILRTARMTAQLESQIATLTAYRKSLIHECVTGQRRISEAEVVHCTSDLMLTDGKETGYDKN